MYWPIPPGQGASPLPLQEWLIQPVRFLSQRVSATDSFLVKVGSHVHFNLAVLGFHLSLICASLIHAFTVSVSSYVHQSCSVWKIRLPFCHLFPLALTVVLPFLPDRSLSFERRVDEEISFRMECSKVSFSAHCSVAVSMFPFTSERSIFDKD